MILKPFIAKLEKIPLFKKYITPLSASSTFRRLANGAFWGGIAGIVVRGFTVIASFFLARLLGQEVFGEYGVINSTAAMISGLAGLGIGTTVTKHVAELRNKDPNRAGRILALSTGMTISSAALYGIIFIGIAPWLATKTLAAPHLAPMLQISAVTVALGVINSVQTCSLAGCEVFKKSAITNIICSSVQTTLVLLGALFWQLSGAITTLAISMTFTVALTRWVVKKEWFRFGIKLNWRESWNERKVLLNFSLPTFLSGLVVGPVMWVCNALLANQPDGYAQLGIYNAAFQWQIAVQFLPSLIGTAVLPVMSERYGNNDIRGSIRIMTGMMMVAAIVVTPISLIICICGKWIMAGYGESFISGISVLYLSVLTGVLFAIMMPVGQSLAASGKMWINFIMNTGWGIAMVLFSWFFVKWGAEGLAGSKLLAYLLYSAWTFCYAFLIMKNKAK